MMGFFDKLGRGMPRLQLTHEMELMGKLRAGHARPLLFVQRKTFRNPAVLY